MLGKLLKVKKYLTRRLFQLGLLRIKKDSSCKSWCIIGLGYMAEVMTTTIDFSRTGRVIAVASRSKEKARRFAIRHKIEKFYDDYNLMVQDKSLKPDIVYICTPLETHYKIIKDCLEAGQNVICEKPITNDDTELEYLFKLAKANDCFLMEAMWTKCLPTFTKALEIVNSGSLGQLKLVRAELNKHERFDENDSNKNAGVLQNYGVYPLAFASKFLNGIPENLNVISVLNSSKIDTNWHINCSKNGIDCVINISSNFALTNKALILGEQGSLVWESPFNRTNQLSHFDSDGRLIRKLEFDYRFEGFEFQVDEVSRCLDEGQKESQLVPLNETLNVIRWMTALKENAKKVKTAL